jgi:hypothetical protein
MRRLIALFVSAATVLAAQTPAKADLLKLADKLDATFQAGDWAEAAQLSKALKLAVEDARNHSMSAVGNELANSILDWLPADTETLIVAQQPFTLEPGDRRKIPTALQAARGYALALLFSAEHGGLLTALPGRTLRLAALGRRSGKGMEENHNPNGIVPFGMVPYQGCGVYAFAEPIGDSIFGRPPDDSILGHRVWRSKGSQNDSKDRETYLVAFIKPDLLMSCNDREFFEQMATRMSAPAQPRALSANLPEWKLVDRGAPFWGICHYTSQTALLANLGEPGEDIGAIGIVVEFGLASDASRARIIAKLNPWQEVAKSADVHGAATVHEKSSGVWELTVEGKPESGPFAVFLMMASLGFVVII